MKVPQFKPFIGNEELRAVREVFKSGWFTEGPKSAELVEKLCSLVKVPYGSLACNGTLALYMGLKALKELHGYNSNDGVLVPNFTFIASSNAILMNELLPHFVDIDPNTLQIDVDLCEKIFDKSKNIRAIMPVHIFGHAVNMDRVVAFASKHNLDIIEDAAQAIGVTWNGVPCGSFGNVGCFSMFADKTISTAEGGFVATKDKNIAEKLMFLRNQGRIQRGSFCHPEVGFNFRMTDLQSAIGVEQIKKLPVIVEKKTKIFEYYCELLSSVEQVKIIKNHPQSNLIPFRVAIEVKGPQQDLSDYMNSRGIEARTFFYPLHKQSCYQFLKDKVEMRDEFFGNSIYAFEHGLCLPSYVSMGRNKIKYVCDTIRKYFHV